MCVWACVRACARWGWRRRFNTRPSAQSSSVSPSLPPHTLTDLWLLSLRPGCLLKGLKIERILCSYGNSQRSLVMTRSLHAISYSCFSQHTTHTTALMNSLISSIFSIFHGVKQMAKLNSRPREGFFSMKILRNVIQ